MATKNGRKLTRRPVSGGVFARIWKSIEAIPSGRAKTYGEVAAETGVSARTVVWALHQCPESVPWHRVVGKGGALALARRSLRAGASQAERLCAEGWKVQDWKLKDFRPEQPLPATTPRTSTRQRRKPGRTRKGGRGGLP